MSVTSIHGASVPSAADMVSSVMPPPRFGVAFAHEVDHDRAQHFADVGEELQPRCPASLRAPAMRMKPSCTSAVALRLVTPPACASLPRARGA